MDHQSLFTYIIVGVVSGLICAMGTNELHPLRLEADYEIQQCEAELPRNQSCEYVISARVKQGDKND